MCDNKGHRLVRVEICSPPIQLQQHSYIVSELYILCIHAERAARRPRSKVNARASGKSVICKLSRVAELWPRKLKSQTSSCVSQSVVSSAFCCTAARAHPPPVADAARARSATPPPRRGLVAFARALLRRPIFVFLNLQTNTIHSRVRVKRHHDDSIVRTVCIYIYIYISEHTPTHRHRRRLPTN